MKRIGYIGSNTDAAEEGIRIVEVDDATGAIRTLAVLKARDAIYMAVNRAKTRLYAAYADAAFGPKGHNGGLAVYAIDGGGAILRKLGSVATGETVPCHVSLAPDERALVFAEYSHGTAGRVALKEDGSFDAGSLAVVRMTEPTGPNKPRQDRPHCHCAIVSADGLTRVVDLGTDRVKAYDAAMREVPAKTRVTAPPGAGPRHILFHPNGNFAFVIFELGNYVTSYHVTDGALAPVQQLSLLPDDWGDGDGNDPKAPHFSKAAAIKLSGDGAELYCSNRGHDSIAVFAVDPGTGLMSRRAILPLGGAYPRDFTFLPGGEILVACLKMSGIVRTYRYDRRACALTPLAEIKGLYRPLYVHFP